MLAEDVARLRQLADVIAGADTLGVTARYVADHAGDSIDAVQLDLDRLARAGLVQHETGPTGSLWYTLTATGERAVELVEHGGEALL